MKKLLISSLLLGTSISASAADDNHYYGGFELGLGSATDNTYENSASGLSMEDDKHLGSLLGLYFGKAMGKWRFEGEYAIRKNRYEGIAVTNGGGIGLPAGEMLAGGIRKSSSLMANAWYEVMGTEHYKFFAGLGVGAANLETGRMHSGQVAIADDRKWEAAGQAMLQVVRQIPGGLELGLGVRHFRTLSTTFTTQAGAAKYPFVNNEVFARLTWRFGGESKPAPAPTPVAVAAPAPAPAMKKPAPKPEPKPEPMPLPGPFVVFFDFDKSTLTADGAAIVKEAVKAFNKHSAVEVMASGHTDTMGKKGYNDALSKKRVSTVKQALIEAGVPVNAIKTDSFGEHRLKISTADDVREPQNRRVEIELKK